MNVREEVKLILLLAYKERALGSEDFDLGRHFALRRIEGHMGDHIIHAMVQNDLAELVDPESPRTIRLLPGAEELLVNKSIIRLVG